MLERKLSEQWTVSFKSSHDGRCQLRTAIFRKDPRVPLRRLVVYFHGLGEWIEKNHEIPEWLDLPADCGFLTWDHRGQGRSTGYRAHVDDFADYVLDGDKIIREYAQGMPYAVIAHSMGSLIALCGVLRQELSPTAIALCAPLIRMPERLFPNSVAKPLAQFLSSIGFARRSVSFSKKIRPRFEENILTHDRQMYEVICNSPHSPRVPTFGWVASAFKSLDFVHAAESMKMLSAKTLVLGPGEEAYYHPKWLQHWAEQAAEHAPAAVRYVQIEGARHELFSEVETHRQIAVNEIRRWFAEWIY